MRQRMTPPVSALVLWPAALKVHVTMIIIPKPIVILNVCMVTLYK